MNIKKMFEYKPNKNRNFILSLSPNNLPEDTKKKIAISNDINKNFEYLKVKYNLLINSDITTREFEINIANKSFKSLLIGYTD